MTEAAWIAAGVAFAAGALTAGVTVNAIRTPGWRKAADAPASPAPTGGDGALRAALDDAASLRDRLAKAEAALRGLRAGR